MKIINYSGITKEEYNNVPVFYCKSCLGLGIKNESDGLGSYCGTCGSASVGRTSLEFWEQSYREKYGKDHLTGYDIPYEKCKHCDYKN
jgi:hypothetical protein